MIATNDTLCFFNRIAALGPEKKSKISPPKQSANSPAKMTAWQQAKRDVWVPASVVLQAMPKTQASLIFCTPESSAKKTILAQGIHAAAAVAAVLGATLGASVRLGVCVPALAVGILWAGLHALILALWRDDTKKTSLGSDTYQAHSKSKGGVRSCETGDDKAQATRVGFKAGGKDIGEPTEAQAAEQVEDGASQSSDSPSSSCSDDSLLTRDGASWSPTTTLSSASSLPADGDDPCFVPAWRKQTSEIEFFMFAHEDADIADMKWEHESNFEFFYKDEALGYQPSPRGTFAPQAVDDHEWATEPSI